jgi:hypothetical protein
MRAAYPELERALAELVARIDDLIADSGYRGDPIAMYLAGGMAVNFYCGTRYTEDVDAFFSHKVLLPFEDMIVDYQRADGSMSFIYLDQNYSPTFSPMHGDFARASVLWAAPCAAASHVKLFVLSAVDLAVSKLARFAEQDIDDVLSLAQAGLFTVAELRERAEQAVATCIGNTAAIQSEIELICFRIESKRPPANAPPLVITTSA